MSRNSPRALFAWGVFCLAGIDLFLRTFLPAEGLLCNPGLAWSISFPYPLLLCGTGGLLLTIFFLWQREKETLRALGWALLVAGGGINFLDRILFGCVRDYLTLPFFPSFNLADIMLTLGVGVLLYRALRPLQLEE